MTRYVLAGTEGRPIVVGWDRPLHTYFVQVWPRGTDVEYAEGEPLLWAGCFLREVNTVEDLARLVGQYGRLPDEVARRLEGDRERQRPKAALARQQGSSCAADEQPTDCRPYYYTRDKDGCDDIWAIHGPGDEWLGSVPFWDEPDTQDWVRRSEALAASLVGHLNTHDPQGAGIPVAELPSPDGVAWHLGRGGSEAASAPPRGPESLDERRAGRAEQAVSAFVAAAGAGRVADHTPAACTGNNTTYLTLAELSWRALREGLLLEAGGVGRLVADLAGRGTLVRFEYPCTFRWRDVARTVTVLVGWDPALETYYVEVWEGGCYGDPDVREPSAAFGFAPRAIPTVQALEATLTSYGVIPDGILRALEDTKG